MRPLSELIGWLTYTHDVLSKRSVSMIYNVTNMKLIHLIFLKEINFVDIQSLYWIQRLKHTLQVLNGIRALRVFETKDFFFFI